MQCVRPQRPPYTIFMWGNVLWGHALCNSRASAINHNALTANHSLYVVCLGLISHGFWGYIPRWISSLEQPVPLTFTTHILVRKTNTCQQRRRKWAQRVPPTRIAHISCHVGYLDESNHVCDWSLINQFRFVICLPLNIPLYGMPCP